MANGVITLQQALEIFRRKDVTGRWVPFDISYRTFSRTTKQGGKLKIYTGVKYLPPADPNKQVQDTIYNILDPVKRKRNPNHFKNRTRNIELANGQIRTVNIDFIDTINNQKVIY